MAGRAILMVVLSKPAKYGTGLNDKILTHGSELGPMVTYLRPEPSIRVEPVITNESCRLFG